METNTISQTIESIRRLESQLTAELQKGNNSTNNNHLAETLDQIRSSCTSALLQDFVAAAEQHVEDRLWNAHHKVNAHFRSGLTRLKEDAEWRVVERRKMGGEYLRFIKHSQKFYRGLIKDLAENYGGIPELEQIAKRVNRNYAPSGTTTRTVSQQDGMQILLSCHRTLIQLGDLSRYRETELGAQERNWAPAVGFYDLAKALYPSSGTPHNQLAIIALADNNLFQATYHLYRALTVEEPHISAGGNLRKAFFKISTAWDKNELIRRGPRATSSSQLTAWYLRLVSMYYHGKAFPEQEELEDEVLGRFTADLKTCPDDSPHYKIVLTSISAGHAAEERFTEISDEKNMQSYLFFFRFNLRALLRMLQVYDEGLEERIDERNGRDESGATDSTEDMNTILDKLLPTLRFYMMWLMKNSRVLEQPIDSMPELTGDFWRVLARVLTNLASAFPGVSVSGTKYMLEEDVETISFKPLQCPENEEIWYEGKNEGKKQKKKYHEIPAKSRSKSHENLTRLKSVLVSGLKLVEAPHAPLSLDNDGFKFYYVTDGKSSYDQPEPQYVPGAVGRSTDASAGAGPSQPSQSVNLESVRGEAYGSLAQDMEAERMVDDLVGTSPWEQNGQTSSLNHFSENDYPMTPANYTLPNDDHESAPSSFAPGTLTADALVEAVRTYALDPRKSFSPKVNSPHALYSAPRSRNQSQVQSPAMNPQPLGSSSYGPMAAAKTLPGYTSRPRTAEQDGSPVNGYPNSPSMLTSASYVPSSMPLPGQPEGPIRHTRVHSNGSNNSVWGPDTASSQQTWNMNGPRGLQSHLGNGTFGTVHGNPFSNGAGSSDYSRNTSIMWGAPASPWNPVNGSSQPNPWNSARMERESSHDEAFADPTLQRETNPWRPNARPIA